jgi:archaellum biogenesis ATPase FlaH
VQIGLTNQLFNESPAEIIQQHSDQNLYFLGNVSSTTEKQTDKDIKEKNYIFFDFDIRLKQGKQEITDQEIKDAGVLMGKVLDESPIFKDWTAIIFTGNGIHVYYYGDLIQVEVTAFTNAMKYLIKEISKYLGVEADGTCCNPARIARLPLSYNNKYGQRKLVEILEYREKHSNLLKELYLYSGVTEAENQVKGIINQIKTQSKNEKGFNLFDQINKLPIAEEVLKDYPQWRFDGKNFWDCNNKRASSAWVTKDNVLIKSDSRWIYGNAQGFCTYTYRKEQSKLSDKDTFEYFKKEYDLKPILFQENYIDPIEDTRTPFTWGTDGLDEDISPIERNHFNIMAGDTGAGKTAFSFDMAIKNALLGHRVLYISLEMHTEAILTRIARKYAGISKKQWRLRRNPNILSQQQKNAYYHRKKEVKSVKSFMAIGIDGVPTLLNITTAIEKYEPDIVFIDNFDLVARVPLVTITESESIVSRYFTDYAKEKHIPIIMIHHFNKNGKKTKDTDDLRGSGKISHNCSTLIVGQRTADAETTLEKAEFNIIEKKDREFGECGMRTVYFVSGTFNDYFA